MQARIQVPALFVLGLLSLPALADPKPLFLIRKPDNPQNLVQTFVSVDPATCKVGNVDFIWLRFSPDSGYEYNDFYSKIYSTPTQRVRAYVKTPNSILHCQILKRIKPTQVPQGSRAGCAVLPAGTVCDQKGLSSDELNKVNNPPPIIVRSVKSASTGACSVAAFMDINGAPVQVKTVSANGSVDNGFFSKTVHFASISVEPTTGTAPPPWACARGCTESFGVEMLSCN